MAEFWIKVVPAEGYQIESRSMADNAAEMISTALHALDHRAYAEALTAEEAAEDVCHNGSSSEGQQ